MGIKGNNQSTIPKNHCERIPDPECGVGLVARVGGEWGVFVSGSALKWLAAIVAMAAGICGVLAVYQVLC